MKANKKGIALLITLFFLMAITISIGIGFKYVNEAKSSIKDENFLLQSNIILDDVLTLLENTPELKMIQQNDEMFDMFLAQSEMIPFEASGVKVLISIKSARTKVNLNNLLRSSDSQLERFREFLNSYNVNTSYIDILKDSVNQNDPPISKIADEKPDMFRDHIASYKQLKEINEFYTNNYYDNSLSQIDFKELFYYGDNNATNKSYCIDNYYMTPWVRHMVSGISLEDAEEFFAEGSDATDINGFKLCSGKDRMYLDVDLEIIKDDNKANISFEYDIKQTKGYNFSYEI